MCIKELAKPAKNRGMCGKNGTDVTTRFYQRIRNKRQSNHTCPYEALGMDLYGCLSLGTGAGLHNRITESRLTLVQLR